jgi:hypothetical protein
MPRDPNSDNSGETPQEPEESPANDTDFPARNEDDLEIDYLREGHKPGRLRKQPRAHKADEEG